MFVGHVALSLAAKRATPRTSLAVLVAAAQFADLLWPILLLLGVEHVRIAPGDTAFTPLDFVSYPWSHSLLLLIGWGLVFALACRAAVNRGRAFGIIAGLVVSHWILDAVTHRPDLPLYPGGGPKIGLGLWNSVPTTLVLELAMFGAGLWIYLQTTRALDAAGRWGLAVLVGLLLLAYIANLFVVPPSVPALAMTAIIGAALIIVLTWWADRHRASRQVSPQSV
jgi:hypothetical protein